MASVFHGRAVRRWIRPAVGVAAVVTVGCNQQQKFEAKPVQADPAPRPAALTAPYPAPLSESEKALLNGMPAGWHYPDAWASLFPPIDPNLGEYLRLQETNKQLDYANQYLADANKIVSEVGPNDSDMQVTLAVAKANQPYFRKKVNELQATLPALEQVEAGRKADETARQKQIAEFDDRASKYNARLYGWTTSLSVEERVKVKDWQNAYNLYYATNYSQDEAIAKANQVSGKPPLFEGHEPYHIEDSYEMKKRLGIGN